MKRWTEAAVLALVAVAAPAAARDEVRVEDVRAHEMFLAGPALQGRGSATRDEAIAAAYVASRFASYGLKPAPGIAGMTQPITVLKRRTTGPATLTIDGLPVTAPILFSASGEAITGKLAVFAGDDLAAFPRADVVLVTTAKAPPRALLGAAAKQGVKLVLMPSTEQLARMAAASGGAPRMPGFFPGEPVTSGPTLATLPSAVIDSLGSKAGAEVSFAVPFTQEVATTTNAVGYLPGTDPAAGVLLLSAHLDHLGVRPDGTVMPGANDDASGTTAVLELARVLSSGKPLRRGILFVCYGSEEAGGFGARWFADHPPVPLGSIVANLEVEMIGSQDPKQPAGYLMMTGYDRSDFGPELRQRGALVGPDQYPEEHFFQRSDNYQLALRGVVAHTVSGFPIPPTYHQPTDTVEMLDFPYMTRAIQSLIAPVRWLANSRFRPSWRAGGQPKSE